jgi:opacity protein-like surface antigen
MTMKIVLLSAVSFFALLTPAIAQNFEVTGQVGGQLNGGLDLATSLFHRIEVGNSLNYGVTFGYLVGEHSAIEFQWNQTKADTRAQPIGGGSSVNVFSLGQNQYMGNFLFHFTDREARTRPFMFFGLGASSLDPDRSGVRGATRFAFSLGAGVKRNLSKHFGLRGQVKWSPTYLTTTDGGYWCDPFWGGCWTVGNDHYLNEFDITGGITLRF